MANQYTLTNDFAEIAEEKGTLYNKGDSAIELASTAETAKGAGILLLTGERRTFSGTLYARSMDAAGLLNVADFNDGGEGGEDDKTGGLPLGSVHPFLQTSIPDGWLSLENGALLTDAAYPGLANLVRTGKVPVITESEWQAKAAAQKSVGYYSSGDGSTTFRLPRIIGFVEGVTAANVGQFKAAGVPNIAGEFGWGFSSGDDWTGGAFRKSYISTDGLVTRSEDFNSACIHYDFDASRSSAIYGASDTVQPESVGLVWCVRAFGAAVNQGTVDITALAQMLNLKLSISDAPRVCTPFAFPSDTYVSVPVSGDGYQYTAPANGYCSFYADGATTANLDCFVRLQNSVSMPVTSHTTENNMGIAVVLPVRKGEIVTWSYRYIANFQCRFYYAKGEV